MRFVKKLFLNRNIVTRLNEKWCARNDWYNVYASGFSSREDALQALKEGIENKKAVK